MGRRDKASRVRGLWTEFVGLGSSTTWQKEQKEMRQCTSKLRLAPVMMVAGLRKGETLLG